MTATLPPKAEPPKVEPPKVEPPKVEPPKVEHSITLVSEEERHDPSKESGRFILIRIVKGPFQHFLQNLRIKTLRGETLEKNLAVQPGKGGEIQPSVTHLQARPLPSNHHDSVPPRKRIPWSFLIIVVLPTLVAFGYFGFIASDQYESTADYVIKTQTGADAAPSGLAGIMGMMGGGHGDSMAMGDSAMVEAYVASNQILKDLAGEIDLRAIYTSNEIDWVSRLKNSPDFFLKLSGRKMHRTTSREISDEDLLKYWNSKVEVAAGKAPGTSTLKVRAFTPEDAKLIADRVIWLGERLVNHVSERAQRDAVVFAQREVDLAHDRAMKSFDNLLEFQEKAKQVDPAGFAKARSEIQGKLEGQLSTMQAQMEALRKNLPEDAPGIQQMRLQVSALQEQLILEKQRSTSTTKEGGKSAAEVINEFSKRQLDTEFASKDYLSALTALETARINASRQNRYLEPFNLPNLPDKPALPKRLYNIVSVLAISLLLWGVWSLFIAGVKEHQH